MPEVDWELADGSWPAPTPSVIWAPVRSEVRITFEKTEKTGEVKTVEMM